MAYILPSVCLLFSCGTHHHIFINDTVITAPTCIEEGLGEHECSECHCIEQYTIPALGHNLSDWEVVYPATYEDDGLEERTCSRCSYSETRDIPKLPYTYKITLDHTTTKEYVYVQEDGLYNLKIPTKTGQTFIKYIDDNGDDFPMSGVVADNITIHSLWNVLETTDFTQLKGLVKNEAELIKISANITLTETLYITNTTQIISAGDYTLTRDSNFLDDLFVVGEDETGRGSIFDDKKPCLILGEKVDNGTSLTIDGNKSNIIGDVFGTGLFISYSGDVEIYDGITFKNSIKTANQRTLLEKYKFSYPEYIGGSVSIIADGVLNIHGGNFINNEVTIGEEDINSCRGGAFYNFSNLNIYGGTFCNNDATKGGAIFTYKTVYITKGVFDGNSASMYGGCLYLPGSQYAVSYLGQNGDNNENSLIIKNNTAVSYGGAIYAGTHSGIVIKGLTSFDSNKATDPTKAYGGAIHTKGTLLVNGARFTNNTATSRGGAIHTMDNDETAVTRENEINNCTFINNSAKNGGAINFYANSIASVNNCTFTSNVANNDGNGGAIYASGNGDDPSGFSIINVYDSTFEQNSAAKGGAAYVTSKANLTISSSNLNKNTSSGTGGAIYVVSVGSKLIINDSGFLENTATTNGGAIYCTTGSYTEINGSTISNNSATSGGAIYISGSAETQSEIKISDSSFTNNSSSANGGALYIYTSVAALIENTSFISNFVTGSGKYGGGAYISGKATVIMKGIAAHSNSASSGGFVYITTTGTSLDIDGATIYDNIATTTGAGPIIHSNSDGSIILIHKNSIVDDQGDFISIDDLVKGKTGGVEEYD